MAYGFLPLIAEINFCWGIVNICHHKNVSCPTTVLLSSQPWFLHESLPFSVLMPLVLGLAACLAFSAWQSHKSKSVSSPSRQIIQEKKRNCPCIICGHVLLSSLSVLSLTWFVVTCCAMCRLSFPKYTLSYVYPVESQSLKILILKFLHFFGMFCSKIMLLLKETITFSIARYSEGL